MHFLSHIHFVIRRTRYLAAVPQPYSLIPIFHIIKALQTNLAD